LGDSGHTGSKTLNPGKICGKGCQGGRRGSEMRGLPLKDSPVERDGKKQIGGGGKVKIEMATSSRSNYRSPKTKDLQKRKNSGRNFFKARINKAGMKDHFGWLTGKPQKNGQGKPLGGTRAEQEYWNLNPSTNPKTATKNCAIGGLSWGAVHLKNNRA